MEAVARSLARVLAGAAAGGQMAEGVAAAQEEGNEVTVSKAGVVATEAMGQEATPEDSEMVVSQVEEAAV